MKHHYRGAVSWVSGLQGLRSGRHALLLFAVIWISSIHLMPNFVSAIELRNSDRATLFATRATELELFGSDLRDEENHAALLWTSFPATIEVLDADGQDRGRLRYRITPTQPIAGVVAIRAYHRDEVSQALLFYVDEEVRTDIQPETDEPFSVPAAFDFQSKGLGEHRIPLRLTEGQVVVAEVFGHRLAGEVDPLLILQNADGEEVAFADDDVVLGSDPILRFQPTYSGLHYLLVRDVQYRGGVRMYLSVRDSGFSGTVFPTAVRVGETREVSVMPLSGSLDSDSLAQGQQNIVSSPFDSSPGLTYFSIANQVVAMMQTRQPVVVEQEGGAIPVPSVYCGQLSSGNERDEIVLSLREGTTLVVKPLETGGPFVGHVHLFRDEKRVAEHHWGLDLRGYLRYGVPVTGLYRLQIQDCLNRTGVGMEYALSIQQNDVTAILKLGDSKKRKKLRNERPHRLAVTAGEVLELNIRVDRRGLESPIRLSAWIDGVPHSSSIEIPVGQSEINWGIDIPRSDEPIRLEKLTVRGYAVHQGQVVEIPLDLTEHLRRDYSERTMWPNLLDGMTLVVSPPGKQADGIQKEQE